jgi:hypothetical protein
VLDRVERGASPLDAAHDDQVEDLTHALHRLAGSGSQGHVRWGTVERRWASDR